MRFLKFLIIASILLFPGIKGCYYPNHSSVIKLDCTKLSSVNKIPDTPGIIIISSSCSDYQFDKSATKSALDVFVENYSDEFEISELTVWGFLRDLKIEVSAIPRTVHAAYDLNGKFLNGKIPVSGLALRKDWIWVEIKTSQIWSSALIHELVHIVIWRQNNVHGDPDHEGKEFSGWTKKHTQLIKKINKILLDAEI